MIHLRNARLVHARLIVFDLAFSGFARGAHIAEEIVVGIVALELVEEFSAAPLSVVHIRLCHLEEIG